MIIIGDAAHAPAPSSGQGASMALEDAVVLAKALRDVTDIPHAFATYDQLRRERVERMCGCTTYNYRVDLDSPVVLQSHAA